MGMIHFLAASLPVAKGQADTGLLRPVDSASHCFSLDALLSPAWPRAQDSLHQLRSRLAPG